MSYQQIKKKTEGFTIIEVLIVLAIAGLILLIVFLAVPQLQRNQRNNSRNNDASRISTLVTECLANRNGKTDLCNSDSEVGFDASKFSQIDTVTWSDTNQPAAFGATTGNEAVVNFKSVCVDGGASDKASGSSRQFSVAFRNEPSTVKRCIGSE
jgi:prepilin-type N-terminal cleavage/methylation domain-containing protein